MGEHRIGRSGDREMDTATCARCGRACPSSEVVRLWDGRDYCRDCVEAECRGLFDFARDRRSLRDTMRHDPAGGLLAWAGVAGLLGGGLVVTAATIWATGDPDLAILLLEWSGVAWGAAMLLSLPSVFRARQVLPRVVVRDGMVEVYRRSHAGRKRPVATFPLSESRWRIGRLCEDSCCRGRGGAIVANRPAVIFRAPRRWKLVAPPSEFNACGSSPEMIARLRGFLRLAGVAEGR